MVAAKLQKYVKEKASNKTTTSVSITIAQQQFIQDNSLNLSKLVRELLDKLMKDEHAEINLDINTEA
jgi:hypothetical protein